MTSESDKELEDLLCELYAYVDEHRARKERDGDDFYEGPETIAHEERKLLNQTLAAIDNVRAQMDTTDRPSDRSEDKTLITGAFRMFVGLFVDEVHWHEPDDPAYKRQEVWIDGSADLLFNTQSVEFPRATKDWGTVAGIGLFGHRYRGEPEDAVVSTAIRSKPIVESGQRARLPPHHITIPYPASRILLRYIEKRLT